MSYQRRRRNVGVICLIIGFILCLTPILLFANHIVLDGNIIVFCVIFGMLFIIFGGSLVAQALRSYFGLPNY